MSDDTQYTALGPAIVGFQTNGSKIQKGAEVAGTVLGLQATGPIGVLGQGQGGPGGEFASAGDLDAQLHLQPHPISDLGPAVAVQPQEFGRIAKLPASGRAGDFFLAAFEVIEPGGAVGRCAMWLCVATSGPHGAPEAQWCQVLLGTPVSGTAHDH
jgi:hypothetical protein